MFSSKSDLTEFENAVCNLSNLFLKNRELLNSSGEELKKVSMNCFSRERSPSGKKWKPLMKSTLRIRKSKNKILNISGKLKRSVTYTTSGLSVTIGTPLKYGAIHQKGNKKGNLAPRPFFGINKGAVDAIRENIFSVIRRGLR